MTTDIKLSALIYPAIDITSEYDEYWGHCPICDKVFFGKTYYGTFHEYMCHLLKEHPDSREFSKDVECKLIDNRESTRKKLAEEKKRKKDLVAKTKTACKKLTEEDCRLLGINLKWLLERIEKGL